MARKTKDNGTVLVYENGHEKIVFTIIGELVCITTPGQTIAFTPKQASWIGCRLQDDAGHINPYLNE